jgi:hypothetical protein
VIRRLVLPAVVLLAFIAALVGGMLAPAPAGGLPAVALASMLVWRVEVAAVVFAAAYAAIVTARLALHGQTYTRVGSGGIDIPQVARAERTQATNRDVDLKTSVNDLWSSFAALAERLAALEDPPDLMLNPDQEES